MRYKTVKEPLKEVFTRSMGDVETLIIFSKGSTTVRFTKIRSMRYAKARL